MNRTILVPPGDDYDWMTLRCNHLMRQFAKNGWTVYWCNRSDANAEVLKPREREPNIYECGLGRWPKSHEEIVDILGIDSVDVIYSNYPFWNKGTFPLERSVTIFDYIDYVDEWIDWEIEAMRDADIITTISSPLKEHLENKHPVKYKDSILLRNACDVDFLNENPAPAPELEGLESPIIGYIGALAVWFDKEAFREIVEHFTTIHVGLGVQSPPYGTITFPMQDYIGVRSFIHGLDVGVHCTTNSITGTMGSPLKIYDYLGCGKPVVCSYNREIDEALGDLVDFVPIGGSFISPIKHTLRKENEGLRERRLGRMREESWDKRYNQLIEPIEAFL